MMKKIILDVDTGIDDSISMAYMCGQKDVDILGITTVFGNVDCDSATLNTRNLLNIFGRHDIAVYQGAKHAINQKVYTQQRGGEVFHGLNGIGNVSLDSSTNAFESESAVDYLIRMAHIHDDVTIVASGPLTNLAQAILKDAFTMSRCKRIVLMGGALAVAGNVSAVAEANILQDSYAAKIVFESGIPIMMVGLDVTSRAIVSRESVNHWQSKNLQTKTLLKIMDHYFKAHELIYPQWGGAAMHDPLAAVVALHEDCIKTISMPITVLTDDKNYGRTVMDLTRIHDVKNYTVDVAIDVDVKKFRRSLFMVL